MTQTKDSVTAGNGIAAGAYGTLLVHAEPGLAASHRVEAAVRLARDLKARLDRKSVV